jgi:hypothetical protein
METVSQEHRSEHNHLFQKYGSNLLRDCSSDMIDEVLSFLLPADLMSFALVCKACSSLVTHELVATTSIRAQGNGRRSIVRVSKLVDKKQTALPSPLRLLRIALGKRCEIPSCDNVVKNVSLFGLFVCKDCVVRRNGLFKTFNPSYKPWANTEPTKRSLILHQRTANWQYDSKHVILAKPFITNDMESAGPLVTLELINIAVNNSLDMVQELPEVDGSNFVSHVNQADQSQLMKQCQDGMAKAERHAEFRRRKVNKTNELFAELHNRYLDESLYGILDHSHWCDSTMTICDPIEQPKSRLYFRCELLNSVLSLSELTAAPSRHTSKDHLRAVAKDIAAVLQPVLQEAFVDFEFLSSSGTHPFYESLRTHLVSIYTPALVLSQLSSAVLGCLADHGPLIALAALLSGKDRPTLRPPMEFCDAIIVYSFSHKPDSDAPAPYQKQLANSLWHIHGKREVLRRTGFRSVCEHTFIMCTKTLDTIEISVKAYLEDPATTAFASSRGGDRTVAWTKIKQDLLVEVWQDQRVIKKFLKRKRDNFNSIRGYHAQEAERW